MSDGGASQASADEGVRTASEYHGRFDRMAKVLWRGPGGEAGGGAGWRGRVAGPVAGPVEGKGNN